jgi:hypothetical protein
MGIRRNKVLYNAQAAGTGSWFRLDSRHEESATRAIQGVVVTGDTITLQGTTYDVKGSTANVTSNITADDIVTLQTYTASFADVINGPWTYIRVVKTGSTGIAKVQGYV